MPRSAFAVLLAVFLTPAGRAAHAQELNDMLGEEAPADLPPPESRWMWLTDLQVRYNPIGLMLANSIAHRDTYEVDGSSLYAGTYRQLGADLNLSPAFVEVGPHAEWKRTNLLVFRVAYNALYYFGTLGYALSFPRPGDPDFPSTRTVRFGDDEAEPLEDAELDESGLAHRLLVQPTFQYRYGSVVVRDQFSGYLSLYSDDFEGPYIRERVLDTLQASQGPDIMIANQAAILWQAWVGEGEARMLVGPFHEIAWAERARVRRHRLGGLFLWIPSDAWGGVHRPRLYVQAGANLEDRNRDGELFVQGGLGADFWLSGR